MFDLVIRGDAGDIAVEDGKIAAIGPQLPGSKKEFDAAGLHILPGLIDVHLHFNEPGREDWEGAATGSRALAAGGGVLFFDMPLNSSPCTVGPREFEEKRQRLAASSVTDFGLWGGVIPGNRDALAELAECGAIGFKAFLCNSGLPEFPRVDDLTLYEGMVEAARAGLLVGVHAESEEITSGLTRRMLADGRHDIAAYLESRPVLAEVEAIERSALLARDAKCKLHVVHISSGRGVVAALEARSLGTDISIETCPHYLFFSDEDLARIGALAKCAPPLRSKDEREALWNCVLRGQVDIVASDHSPCPPEMKRRENFFEIWGGIAGVQSTLNVLLDKGYHRRGLTLERITALTAARPAERFGIAGKGSIAVGNDADFAVADLNAVSRLEAADLHQKHPITPYAGCDFHGHVRHTFRRGELVFSDGKIMSDSPGSLVKSKFFRRRDATSGTNA
jgi:allantoinase